MAVWNKVYAKVNWQNKPSRLTPLGRSKLSIHDDALDIIDDRVIQLNENKADKTEIGEAKSLIAEAFKRSRLWDESKLANPISEYGFGMPTTATSEDRGKQYLDLATGFVYTCVQQGADYYVWRQIDTRPPLEINEIGKAVSKIWDLGAYSNITLKYSFGNPKGMYDGATEGSNAYVLDVLNGIVYKNTRTGESTYSWVQDAQLALITDNLTTKTETHNLADSTQKWVNGFSFSINYQDYGEPDSDRYESTGDKMYLDKSNGRLWKTYYGSWVPTTLYLSTLSDNNKRELTQEAIEREYMYKGDTKYFYFAEADVRTGNAGEGISIDTVKALNDIGTWDGNNYTIGGITYSIGVSNDGYITGISFEGISEGSSLTLCRVNDSVYVETYLFDGNEKIAYIQADSEYSHIKDVGYGIVCMMEENTPVTVTLYIPSGVNATELRDWSSSAGLREMNVWSLKDIDFNDLANKPTIPTRTSELTNDSGFITSHQDISGKYNTTGGTISGDVRIKGSGNYGNKLNLGDGDYVYISEPSDDVMEIHGSSGIYSKDTLYFGAVSGNSKSYKVDASGNADFNALTSGGTAVCLTNDSRLSDSRTPTSHRSTSASTYGAATGTYYGHAKLSDTYDTVSTSQKAANSVAASAWALQTAYTTLNNNFTNMFKLVTSSNYTVSISAGGAVNITANNLGISTPSGYKPIALVNIFISSNHVFFRSFNAQATGSGSFAVLRNVGTSAQDVTISATILYCKSDFI